VVGNSVGIAVTKATGIAVGSTVTKTAGLAVPMSIGTAVGTAVGTALRLCSFLTKNITGIVIPAKKMVKKNIYMERGMTDVIFLSITQKMVKMR